MLSNRTIEAFGHECLCLLGLNTLITSRRPGPSFELDERHADGRVWLKLTGELDLATAPRLADRLHQLRAENRTVVVDLSGVEFMDSSGLHVLFDAVADARTGRWTLDVHGDLSPQVRRVFELMGLERVILATPAADPRSRPAAGCGSQPDGYHGTPCYDASEWALVMPRPRAPLDDLAVAAMGEPRSPVCLFCAASIGRDDPVVLVAHNGDRLTSLAREPQLADDPRALLVHARCAQTLDVRRRSAR